MSRPEFRIRIHSPGACIVALLLLFAEPLHAQGTVGTINGRVVDRSSRQPLSNATVVIDGTSYGTTTDTSGRFIIANVPAGPYTVRARRIGFESATRPVTVTANQTTSVEFALGETAVTLDEVVVTGTAAATRAKEVGTSIAKLSGEEIANVPTPNAQELLAGKVTGVTFMLGSGQPGAGATVKIRGITSVSQESEPLIYVDGIRIFNEPVRAGWGGRGATNPLQDIAPEDIESIEIVKGAAATTLYGTEASSGVLVIQTKRGFAGEPIWNAELSAGVFDMGEIGPPGDPTNLFTECGDPSQLYGLATSGSSIGERRYFIDPTCPADGDWWDAGGIQNYTLSVRGGAGRVTYYMSGNFGDQRSFLPVGGARDGGFRGNFGFAANEELGFQLSTSYQRRQIGWVGDGNNAEGFLLNVGRGYRNYLQGGKGEDCAGVPADVTCVTNAYMFDQTLLTKVDHYTTGFTTTYTPIAGMTNRFTIGWDFNNIFNNTSLPFAFLTYPEGYYWPETTEHTKLSLDYAGSFQNRFGEKLASTFSWGGQLFRDSHQWVEIDLESFAGPEEPTVGSGSLVTYRNESRIAETSAGFFLQEMLGWEDRLFVTAGLRVDGHSAFGDEFGLQMYPKLSLAYVLSDHDFWPGGWFETFKLRGAMGESGKAPSAFDKLRTWTSQIGDEDRPGFTPLDIGNPEVGPERTMESELGFDASFLSGRVGTELTVYRATTRDALIGVLLPPSQGFLARQTQNIGELRNEGLEIMLTLNPVRYDAVDLRVRLNGSWMRSEALDLGGEEISADNKAEFREKHPAPTYFGRRIANPDAIAMPIIETDEALGNVFPTRLLGVGTTLALWTNLTLEALFEHQGGHFLPNYTGYQNARRGVWYPCYGVQERLVDYAQGNTAALDGVTALERARCALDALDGDGPAGATLVGAHSDFWVEKADFVKLRHLTVSYNLPDRWFIPGTSNATISIAGRNLLTWTDYSGTDPEVEDFTDRAGTVFGGGELGRRDYYQIPPARSYTLSLRFSY